MSACCRRVTAAASATPATDYPILRRTSSSINYLHINRRQSWQRRGTGGVALRSRRWVITAAVIPREEEEEDEIKNRSSRLGAVRLIETRWWCLREMMKASIGGRRYVIVYFSILYLRYQAGKVTDEMLSLPKSPLIAVGLLEALAAASGMAAGAILSGAAIPILSQSFLVWQLVLSYIFLGRRYRFNQLFGCFLVAVGVVVTVASGSGTGSLMEAGLIWSILMIISFLLQAADTVLKETIFLDAAQRLKGGTVDLFVVNSYGSAYQAIFICLLLPLLSNLWGIPFCQLPNYLKDGAACFLNIGTMSNKCNGAPLLPLLFVIVNMGFNISLLHLLKISSAVVSCLASTLSALMLHDAKDRPFGRDDGESCQSTEKKNKKAVLFEQQRM
ncbi:hypothetical protein DH2020_024497 [Rehmannia glutinosa]|uniref:Uncharacterized protein n=1 Tax=Rehmannia glutinosa TaxID=99300 RepID=A0ABR0W6F6_REHGL